MNGALPRPAGGFLPLVLRLAAPYLAVGIGWCLLHDAWLTILLYHAQILAWWRQAPPRPGRPRSTKALLLVLPAALAGPALYLLLPHIARTDVAAWLAHHQLNGRALLFMIPYFGLVHPGLEQLHWAPLRERTASAHPAFAGYHLLVLGSLLTAPWLAVCCGALLAASLAWGWMWRARGGAWVAIASHVAADLGVVLAAWLIATRSR